jgi:hypothetical protein
LGRATAGKRGEPELELGLDGKNNGSRMAHADERFGVEGSFLSSVDGFVGLESVKSRREAILSKTFFEPIAREKGRLTV